MRLLKLVVIVFLIYFIRRFIQLYGVMKKIQENQVQRAQEEANKREFEAQRSNGDVIEADFKVVK